MKKITSIYRFINLISLDIAFGAVVCSIFFAQITQNSVNVIRLILLGLTVWVIYTGDHLLDAFVTKHPAKTQRHRFHQKHFFMLLIAFYLVLSIIGVLLFFIKTETLIWGVITFHVVLGYLLIRKYVPFVKEIGVATLFCVGVLLPILIQMDEVSMLLFRSESMLFFGVAIINVMLFSWFECTIDSDDQSYTFAVYFGRKKTKLIILIMFAIQALLLIQSVFTDISIWSLGVLAVMSLMLLVLLLFPGYYFRHERYRLMGDAVFLVPLLAVL